MSEFFEKMRMFEPKSLAKELSRIEKLTQKQNEKRNSKRKLSACKGN